MLGELRFRSTDCGVHAEDAWGHSVFWHEGPERARWLAVRAPSGAVLRVGGEPMVHPDLGTGLRLTLDGVPLACVSSWFDVASPREIPALSAPGTLPSGSGTALLAAIAWLATRAGRTELRYCGPWPTPALFDSLLRSFVPDCALQLALKRFLEEPTEVGFRLTPLSLAWPAGGPCVAWRDGVVLVWALGHCFVQGEAPREVLLVDGGWALDFMLARRRVGRIGVVGLAGAWVEGPEAPEAPSPAQAPMPARLRELVGEVMLASVPRAYQPVVALVWRSLGLRFADIGLVEAQLIGNDVLCLNAGLLPGLAVMAPQEVVAVLAAAVEPLVWRVAQVRLQAAMSV